MTVHHADFAIPVTHHLEVTTSTGVAGQVIALGWWVEADADSDPDHESTGTLYLVVDGTKPRPIWVPEGDLTSVHIER